MNDNDTMTRIADARIARALRMLSEKFYSEGFSDVGACAQATAAALEAAERAPKVPSCRSCGDQWGLCDCGPASEPPAAPEPLPPLEGPTVEESEYVRDAIIRGREWERIARAERAARERERAKFADVVTLMNESAALAKKAERERDEARERALRMQSAKEDAERERDEAQATAARIAVERNALREQRERERAEMAKARAAWDAALRALGEA